MKALTDNADFNLFWRVFGTIIKKVIRCKGHFFGLLDSFEIFGVQTDSMHSTAALVANQKIIISFQPLMPDFLSAVRFVGVLAASLAPDH